jgi:hypothetical protein
MQSQHPGLFILADSRHHWAQMVGEDLPAFHKGFGHAFSKDDCNLGVSGGRCLLNFCF